MRTIRRAIVLGILTANLHTAAPQSAPATPSFEVASIKAAPPSSSSGIRGGPGSTDPGRITIENMSLRDLIGNAYRLKGYELTAPDWLASTRFDIVAAVPAGATKEQIPLMWQKLLAERFKLTVHRETKEMPVYDLVVAKGGPRLTEAPPDDGAQSHPSSGASGGGSSISAGFNSSGVAPRPGGWTPTNTTRGEHMTMAELAATLWRGAERPVLDKTGLAARYKIDLQWQREGVSPAPADAVTGPSLFAALQEQLGLKLEPGRAPIEILVVDHVEKTPVEN